MFSIYTCQKTVNEKKRKRFLNRTFDSDKA